MSVDGQGQALPPNWYPDPKDPRLLRYWTGTQWTEHTSPTATAGTPPVPRASGGGSKTLVWIAVAVVAVGLILAALAFAGVFAAVSVPVILDQRQEAADAAAKSDVSNLAVWIQTWYVDVGDGPPPAIETSGGHYYLDGFESLAVSPGVVLGGVTGTEAMDWCVWVTNPEGDVQTFEYSAARGLQAGTC